MSAKTKCEVTVIVATFNQPLNKVILTLNSILIQKDVKIRVIMADDCSKENNFDKIEKFFSSKSFNDFLLLPSQTNNGTVKNYLRCMEYCNSEFVKFFSPGDAFYDEHSLFGWLEWVRRIKAEASVCNAIYYGNNNGHYECIREHTYPQNVDVFKYCTNTKKQKYYQLLCNDYWLGAATLIETSIATKYLNEITGIVKYGEDSIYRLMAYDEVKRCHYPKDIILYECDTGVSSLGEIGTKWHKILMDEWYETSLIVLNKMKRTNDKQLKKFNAMVQWKITSNFRGSKLGDKNLKGMIKELLPLYLKFPGLFFWHLRTRCRERVSNTYDNRQIQALIKKYSSI